MQPSLKKNEVFVYQNMLHRREKTKRKFKIHDLVRTADLKKTFLTGDSTNWSNEFYKTTEIIKDTIRSFRIDNLLEQYNEALLKKTK